MSQRRRIVLVFGVLALGGVLATALLTGLIVWWVWFPGRGFDAAVWQADTNGSGARQAMADRMLAQGTLIGMTREQVVTLLGDPYEGGYGEDWDLVYRLGPERGFIRIDTEWLVIRLGPEGRAVEARLTTD